MSLLRRAEVGIYLFMFPFSIMNEQGVFWVMWSSAILMLMLLLWILYIMQLKLAVFRHLSSYWGFFLVEDNRLEYYQYMDFPLRGLGQLHVWNCLICQLIDGARFLSLQTVILLIMHPTWKLTWKSKWMVSNFNYLLSEFKLCAYCCYEVSCMYPELLFHPLVLVLTPKTPLFKSYIWQNMKKYKYNLSKSLFGVSGWVSVFKLDKHFVAWSHQFGIQI